MGNAALLICNRDHAIECDSADFDGANDYMSRGTGLTGVVDGKKGLLSAWFRLDGGDATNMRIMTTTNDRIQISRDSANTVAVGAKNAAGTTILQLNTVVTYTSNAAWRHLLASWDLATPGARSLYINDILDVSVALFTNDTIDYAMSAPDWFVSGSAGGSFKWNGCLAELYFDPTNYLDFSVASNRRLFRTAAGGPADLGTDGSRPTGAAPALYLALNKGEAVANFATNAGTGGNFTITGTLDTGSTSPSD